MHAAIATQIEHLVSTGKINSKFNADSVTNQTLTLLQARNIGIIIFDSNA